MDFCDWEPTVAQSLDRENDCSDSVHATLHEMSGTLCIECVERWCTNWEASIHNAYATLVQGEAHMESDIVCVLSDIWQQKFLFISDGLFQGFQTARQHNLTTGAHRLSTLTTDA